MIYWIGYAAAYSGWERMIFVVLTLADILLCCACVHTVLYRAIDVRCIYCFFVLSGRSGTS